MKRFSFIHAADLHIGSPFSTLTKADKKTGDLLLASTFKAFDNIIGLAISKGVDFVLFCGDLFDSVDRNLRAVLHFRNGMKRLNDAGIRAFIIHGNHDPLEQEPVALDLPKNCYVFPASGGRWQTLDTGEKPFAAIFGISFPRSSVEENLALKVPVGPTGLFKIVMLHCTVGQQPGHYPYAPCTFLDLAHCSKRGLEIDYWALGHVHVNRVLCKKPFIAYPGVIQGRSFREQGKKGVFIVNVTEGKEVDLDFRATDVVRWHELAISATSFTTLSSLMDQVWKQIQSLRNEVGSRATVVRIIFTGRSELFGALSVQETLTDMLEELRDGLSDSDPFIWVDSIKNLCRRHIDLKSRRSSSDLVGMILQEADAIRTDPKSRAQAEKSLYELLGNRTLRSNCPEGALVDMEKILEEAEYLLLDLLED